MALVEKIPLRTTGWLQTDRLERRLRDYIDVSVKLVWQRQGIFLAATLLAVFYFDPFVALAAYFGVLFTEFMDFILVRRINKWTDHSPQTAIKFLVWVMFNTALSAVMICLFVITIAVQQSPGGHFTPLFFLFAAALFAAMNNHQLLPALFLRLAIYGISFLLIASMDIWQLSPPITSYLWLEFFTVIFVLYFILDCSLVFLRLYRNGLRQLEEIRVEHERAKKAYEVKSQFLSTISHELKTPLTSIKFSLDLIESGCMGEIPEQIAPVVDIASKNSKRLANLIDETLDLQKIEAGEMIFRFQTINVVDMVKEAAEAIKAQADSMNIQLKTTYPDEQILIKADGPRMMQVMGNLLSNALKFSHSGGVVAVRVEGMHNRVRISVEDTGIGIPEGSKSQVFGRFSQIDSSDQRQVGGAGLGLNITKRIVEKHNGTIDYTSQLGQGTTFFMEFECCDDQPEELQAAE